MISSPRLTNTDPHPANGPKWNSLVLHSQPYQHTVLWTADLHVALIYNSVRRKQNAALSGHLQRVEGVEKTGGALCTSTDTLWGSQSWPRPLGHLLCKWRSGCMMISSCNCWLPRKYGGPGLFHSHWCYSYTLWIGLVLAWRSAYYMLSLC